LIGFGSISDSCRADDGKGFYVQPADSNVDLSKLQLKSATVLPPPSKDMEPTHLPDIKARETIFSKSGLTPFIKALDPFDRDTLYLNLKSKDPNIAKRIIEHYPPLKNHEPEIKKARVLTAGDQHE
jgi:hypothetical protein